MKEQLTIMDMPALIDSAAEYMEPRRSVLAELDSQTGDGDMGVTIALIFRAAKECAGAVTESLSLDAFFRNLYETIGETAPSTFGTFIATMFRTIARNGKELAAIDAQTYPQLLQWAAEGVMKRGKGKRGDKTLLDALIPAAEAAADLLARRASDVPPKLGDVSRAAREAAESGANEAAGMVAKIGRAGYMGERTIGMKDPGAEAIAMLLAAIDDFIQN